MKEELPNLYTGSWKDANDTELLKEKGITHILDVSSNSNRKSYFPTTPDVVYAHFALEDNGLIDILQSAMSFIHAGFAVDGKVFVFCTDGKSRCRAITTCYLIKYKYDTHIPSDLPSYFIKQIKERVVTPFGFKNEIEPYGESQSQPVLYQTQKQPKKNKRNRFICCGLLAIVMSSMATLGFIMCRPCSY